MTSKDLFVRLEQLERIVGTLALGEVTVMIRPRKASTSPASADEVRLCFHDSGSCTIEILG
jgi:hypothetical protein